jgi:hypothetical protein
MSRLSKFLLLFAVIAFILACNTVTKPITDVQNVASTVQSVASANPMETLQAITTSLPVQTLEAIPSSLPDVGNMLNPQGDPVKEWNGVPVMSQATAGQEFPETKSYTFKATATVKDATDFYNTEMVKLGWSSAFGMPSTDQGAVLAFSKDSSIFTITITAQGDSIVVILTSA